MKTLNYMLSASVLIMLSGCTTHPQNESTPGITGTNTVFPETYGAPVELNNKFNNGLCHVRTLIRSIGTGTDMSINGIAHSLYEYQRLSSTVIHDLYTQQWGREGEYAICAQVLNPMNIPILKIELNQIITDFTGTIRGVVTIDS
tara:strand:- start:14849 stop:15283 length:435 start_codon:yes stop_codon:yes gene_type:complete